MLFIEYERTFGRGKAFEMTHGTSEESTDPAVIGKYGGYAMQSYAHSLMDLLPKIIGGYYGEPQDVPKFIERLKKFRLDSPLLYEDADVHQGPGHQY